MTDDRGRDALAWLLARAPRVRALSLDLRARIDEARPAPLALGAVGLWSTGPHGRRDALGWAVARYPTWVRVDRAGGSTPGGGPREAPEPTADEAPASPPPEEEAPDDGPVSLELSHQFVDAPLLVVSADHTSEEVTLDTFDTHTPDELVLEVDD